MINWFSWFVVDLVVHDNSAPSHWHKEFLVVDQQRVCKILEPVPGQEPVLLAATWLWGGGLQP